MMTERAIQPEQEASHHPDRKGFEIMSNHCEICGVPNKETISFLEYDVWEFNQLIKEEKDTYNVCYACFNQHTEKNIELDTDLSVRKERSRLYMELVEQSFPCPSCQEPLTVGHICEHNE